jgi:hypothetical protein
LKFSGHRVGPASADITIEVYLEYGASIIYYSKMSKMSKMSNSHHQILIIKFSSSNSNHQILIIKFSSSNSHHQILIIKF